MKISLYQGLSYALFLSMHTLLLADIDFNSRSSHFAIKTTNSKLKLGNVNKIFGWTQESIVKDFGHNIPSSWTEQYATGNVVAKTGGTSSVYSNLIYSNSNTIVTLDRQLGTIDHGPNNFGTILLTSTAGISTSPISMTFDVNLSTNHYMKFDNTDISNFIVDGNGHSIDLASKAEDVIVIPAGVKVQFKNVVFKNYNDAAFDIGAGSSVYFGDGTRLELNESQSLERPWRFQGNTQIRGWNNALTLTGESIVVAPHSHLTIVNTLLDGLGTSNLRCDHASSQLDLNNSRLCLDDNYNFSSGFMNFINDVRITGSKNFTYASRITSSIDTASRLHLQYTTFRYQPPVNKRDLLGMSDATSTLLLEGATLDTTTTGMRLTNGTLIVDHINSLINPGATSISEGFSFGNGSSGNDLGVIIKPGGSLRLESGILDYQNVDA